MKKIFLIFLFISFLVVAEDWDAKFADVCKIDSYCRRLKASDGTWFRPKSEIMALLKNADVQNEIKMAAKKYNVDPTAVAGAIVAENSLNVGVKDSVQTWLASKMGITSIGTKNFSFGLGQISLPAAREAEIYMAKLENRAPKPDSELTQEIADPMGSIRIAASIIRKVQDDYKAQGFDISKDPGVLTTLYNLGGSEEKAKAAKAAGRLPQVNYFGLFVNKYSSDIKTAGKLSAPVAVAAVAASAPAPAATTVKVADVAKGSSEDEKSTLKPKSVAVRSVAVSKSNKNLVKYDTVVSSLPLLSSPLLCDLKRGQDYGQNIELDTKNSGYGAPVGVLEKDEIYSEVGRALDCKSNTWKLVQGSEKKTGWVQEDQLEKVKTSKLDEAKNCKMTKEEIVCRESVAKKVGALAVDIKTPMNGLLFIKPISKASEGKISFKNEDFRCGNREPETEDYQRSSRKSTAKKPVESRKEIKEAAESVSSFLNSEIQRMSKKLKMPIDQLKEPENPYAALAALLLNAKEQNQYCLRNLNSELPDCQVDPRTYTSEFRKKISDIEYEKNPEFNKISQINMDLNNLYYSSANRSRRNGGSSYLPDQSEIDTSTPEEVKESLVDCNERLRALQEDDSKKFQEKMQALQNKVVSGDGAGGRVMNNGYWGGGMYGSGAYGSGDVIPTAAQASEEQIKKYFVEFMGLAKFCHARLNLVSTSSKKNKFSCSQAPKYLNNNFQLHTKDIVVKMYEQNPGQLAGEIVGGAEGYIPQDVLNEIKGIQPKVTVSQQRWNDDYGASYCPNKTAEYIEDLLKENPCIRHVYVPTRFLSNKLDSSEAKVIYRQFEEDGSYAIEVGDPSCK